VNFGPPSPPLHAAARTRNAGNRTEAIRSGSVDVLSWARGHGGAVAGGGFPVVHPTQPDAFGAFEQFFGWRLAVLHHDDHSGVQPRGDAARGRRERRRADVPPDRDRDRRRRIDGRHATRDGPACSCAHRDSNHPPVQRRSGCRSRSGTRTGRSTGR